MRFIAEDTMSSERYLDIFKTHTSPYVPLPPPSPLHITKPTIPSKTPQYAADSPPPDAP